MAAEKEKEKGQRRVYVLPNELVERIVAYQEEMGIHSEVEAARRLLDAALQRLDNWRTITRRFKDRLKETRVVSDIAKDVLVGHPLVSSISFSGFSVKFALTTGEIVEIDSHGKVEAWQDDSYDSKRLVYDELDDDIPF